MKAGVKLIMGPISTLASRPEGLQKRERKKGCNFGMVLIFLEVQSKKTGPKNGQNPQKLNIMHQQSRRVVRRLLLTGAALSLITVNASQAQTSHALHGVGSVHPGVTRSPRIAAMRGTEQLNLAIGVPARNRAELTAFLADINDPANPNYRHYLTGAQFNEAYGPTEADYATLTTYLKAHGFTVTQTYPNRLIVDVSGTIANIESTFHVKMYRYKHPTEDRTFFGPDAEPTLDQDLPILDIEGLDNFVLPHPKDLRKTPPGATTKQNGSGPSGNFIGKDFRAAYAPGVSLDGSGQTIALFELGSYYPADISTYCSQAGLPNANITKVLVNGVSGNPSPGDDTGEQSLDIEVAHAMAPGAKILFYTGNSPADILNRIASDNLAKTVSSSFGFSPGPSTTTQILNQMAAQGQTPFDASGDSGYGSYAEGWDDSPGWVSVGATYLTTNGAGGSYASEIGSGFSGGWVSDEFAIPSWQQGINMSSNGGSTTHRNGPDVAMVGEQIYFVYNNGSSGGVGGTSVSSPLWAGFTALVNQNAANNGKPPVGLICPAIYGILKGSSYTTNFHDITSGNNGEPAIKGYDLVTGIGSPTGQALITSLSGGGSGGIAGTHLVVNKASGLALDDPGSSTANGTAIVQYSINSASNQKWTFTQNSDGSYTLINGASGKALDDPGFSTANGTVIDQWTSDAGTNQHWRVNQNSDGSYTILNVASGKALDDPGFSTSNNTKIDQWTSDNGANQHWSLQ